MREKDLGWIQVRINYLLTMSAPKLEITNVTPQTSKGKQLLKIYKDKCNNIQDVIAKNHIKLIKETVNVSEFLDTLYKIGILTEDKTRTINSGTEWEQLDRIYSKVQHEDLGKLIFAWEKDNKPIIDTLYEYAHNNTVPINTRQEINEGEFLRKHDFRQEDVKLSHHEVTPDSKTNPTEEELPLNPKTKSSQNAGKSKSEVTIAVGGKEAADLAIVRIFGKKFSTVGLLLCVIAVLLLLIFLILSSFLYKTFFISENKVIEESTIQQGFENIPKLLPFTVKIDGTESTDTPFIITSIQMERTTFEKWTIPQRTTNKTSQLPTTRHHESFTTKTAKPEFIKVISVEEMRRKVIKDPLELSKLTETSNELFLEIAPTKLQNWDVRIFNPDNVRAITIAGYLNPESVISIIKKFRLFLTHVTFSFENNLCDEFYDYSGLPSTSKVELPFLQEIHFEGDVDCGNIFRFIINEVSLRNIRILKFTETNMIYNSVSCVREIFQHSQSTLEYIYLNEVSFCSNCKLFGNLDFSRLKLAEFSFRSGASAPENADAINRFNSDIPVNCRSTYPNEKKVRVEC